MKGKNIFIALFVVLWFVVLALVFGACSSPAGSEPEPDDVDPVETETYTGTRDNVTYILVIEDNTFTLTVRRGGTEKISSGSVVSFTNNVLPYNPRMKRLLHSA